METVQCRFLWVTLKRRKYLLMVSDVIKDPIQHGGLGSKSLVDVNKASGKWLWRSMKEQEIDKYHVWHVGKRMVHKVP